MLSRSFIERLILLLIGGYVTYYTTSYLLEKSMMLDCLDEIDINIPKSITLNTHEKVIYSMKINNDDIDCSFKSIKGHDEIKNQIETQIIKPLNYIKNGNHHVHPPNGIIFHGPPGTGKTMLVKALCKSTGFNFINFSTNVIENKLFGESNKLINSLFTLADKIKPCIIFIDEIDGFFSTRNDFDQGFVNGLKTLFYTKMDGLLKKDSSIVFIGATNRLTCIDPAMMRRMRLHIQVSLPDWNTRKQIFLDQLQCVLPTEINLDGLEDITKHMSGSDINEFSKSILNSSFDYESNKFNEISIETLQNQIKLF